jgi:hypothetical protein
VSALAAHADKDVSTTKHILHAKSFFFEEASSSFQSDDFAGSLHEFMVSRDEWLAPI